jgi:hypothetical protein
MDKKPLDPQLKQIYDRIMTTPTKTPNAQPGTASVVPQQAPTQFSQPQAPQQPLPTPMQNPSPPAATQPAPFTSFASVKPASSALAAPQIFPSLSQNDVIKTPAPTQPASQTQPLPTTQPASSPYYASTNTSFAQSGTYIPPVNIPPPMPMSPDPMAMPSIPARPLRNTADPIIFSTKNRGKNTVTIGAPAATGAQVAPQKSANVLAMVIGMLVVVFLLAYSVFWLIFFGIIEI